MKKMVLVSVLFCLVMLVGLSSVYGQENLLVNSDFEKVTPDGKAEAWVPDFWQPGATMMPTTAKVYSGKYAFMIKADASNDVRLMQTVRVKPKTHYRFSGWVAGENIPAGKTGANICIMGGYDFVEIPAGTTNWTRLELNFRTGSTQNEVILAVRLGMYTKDNSGTAYFDELKLEESESVPQTFSQIEGPATEQNTAESNQTTSKPGGGKLNGGLLLLGVLVILLGVNFFFYFRGKKKANTETTDETTDEMADETTIETTEDTKE